MSRQELFCLGRLSGPLCAIYAADIGMYLVDVAVIGRLGLDELAGVAVAEQCVFLMIAVFHATVSMFVVGMSRAMGQEQPGRALSLLLQGVVVSVVLGLAGVVVAWNLERIFTALGFDATIVGHGGVYARTVSWCIVPYLLFLLIRGFLAAIDTVDRVLPIVVAAVIVNVPLSYGFTFGELGLPQLGVAGAGVSTSVVTLMMALLSGLPLWGWIRSNAHELPTARSVLSWADFAKTLRKGGQASASTVLEDGLFMAMGAVVAGLGALPLAVHYLANSITNVSMVVANGVGDAASIRVALKLGRGDVPGLRSVGVGALVVSVAPVMLGSAAMIIYPHQLAEMFTGPGGRRDDELIQLVGSVFALAAVSQIFEVLQVVAIRSLRGMEDTLVPLFTSLLGYWVIALPVGLLLAYAAGLGIHGVWIGAIAGLSFASVVLTVRFWRLAQAPAPVRQGD